MIVVFGTTAIYSERPSYPGQRPVYGEGCAVHGYRIWSTGKLENAIAQGLDVYVCTVRPVFGPQDAWWRAIVPPDRIYRPRGEALLAPAEAYEHFLVDPWRRFFADIGRPWPAQVKDTIVWRMSLDGADGLLYGDRIHGHTGASA